MPTLVGPWQGSTPSARIEVDYTTAYSEDFTQVYISGTVFLASDQSMSDSTNNWSFSGELGSASGSGTSYSHGSGGGRTAIMNFGGWRSTAASIGMSVTGLEGPGATISATFTLHTGPLAPYTDGAYYAESITSSTAVVAGVNANGNGGTLTNMSAQANTSPTEAGSMYFEAGGWGNVTMHSLSRYTTWYFRARVANSTWGWGTWGPWKSFQTLAEAPSPPPIGVDSITPTTARIVVASPTDSGGPPVDAIDTYVTDNYALPGAGGNVVAYAPGGTFTATGLLPSTRYYFTSAARNSAGYWSAWAPMQAFTTLPAGFVNVGGVWKNAIPYVCTAGQIWKMATPYVNVAGVWKLA